MAQYMGLGSSARSAQGGAKKGHGVAPSQKDFFTRSRSEGYMSSTNQMYSSNLKA